MSNTTESIQRPTIRQEFAKLRQTLKRGILTLPAEGKVPLKWKPMWIFLGKEFQGTRVLFKDWDASFVFVFLRFLFVVLAGVVTALAIMMFAGNASIPVVIRYFIPVGCIALMFITITESKLLAEDKIVRLKKTRIMAFKVLSFACIIAMAIGFLQLSLILPVSYVLLPLGMAMVILWLITEVFYICTHWPTKQQWKDAFKGDD